MVRLIDKVVGNVKVKERSISSTIVAEVCQQYIDILFEFNAHTGEAPEKSLTANYRFIKK